MRDVAAITGVGNSLLAWMQSNHKLSLERWPVAYIHFLVYYTWYRQFDQVNDALSLRVHQREPSYHHRLRLQRVTLSEGVARRIKAQDGAPLAAAPTDDHGRPVVSGATLIYVYTADFNINIEMKPLTWIYIEIIQLQSQ